MARPRNGEDFADELMDSDLAVADFEGHPGGAVHKVIRWAFEHQGAYQPPGAAQPVVTAGAPRKVDVYIDDGRHGEYDPTDTFLVDTTDIWTRRAADDGQVHEEPIAGVPCFVYVRVRNRGTEAANNLSAVAFTTADQGDMIWPTAWQELDKSGATIPDSIPSGGAAVAGPFEWHPDAPGDQALLLSVSADDDDGNADTINGPIAAERLAQFDNNVAIRRISPVAIA